LEQVEQRLVVCSTCGNIDTGNPCGICVDPRRDIRSICVVEDVSDLWALDRSRLFPGKYHVLGGRLSALDGVRPEDLNIEGLVARVAAGGVDEVVLAMNATLEGQTTAHYLAERLEQFPRPKIVGQEPVGVAVLSSAAHHLELVCGLDQLSTALFLVQLGKKRCYAYAKCAADTLKDIKACRSLTILNSAQHRAGHVRAGGKLSQRQAIVLAPASDHRSNALVDGNRYSFRRMLRKVDCHRLASTFLPCPVDLHGTSSNCNALTFLYFSSQHKTRKNVLTAPTEANRR
jgi:recombination protein RecR